MDAVELQEKLGEGYICTPGYYIHIETPEVMFDGTILSVYMFVGNDNYILSDLGETDGLLWLTQWEGIRIGVLFCEIDKTEPVHLYVKGFAKWVNGIATSADNLREEQRILRQKEKLKLK